MKYYGNVMPKARCVEEMLAKYTFTIDAREKVSKAAFTRFQTERPKVARYYHAPVLRNMDEGDWHVTSDDVDVLISFKFDDLLSSMNARAPTGEDLTGIRMSHLEWELNKMRKYYEQHTNSAGRPVRLGLICCGNYDQATLARLIGYKNHYPEIHFQVNGKTAAEVFGDEQEAGRIPTDYTVNKPGLLDGIWDEYRQRWAVEQADRFVRLWKEEKVPTGVAY